MEITEYKEKMQKEMEAVLYDLIRNWEDEVVEFKEASNDFDKVDKYDKRSHGRPIRVKFKGELRDQQALASLQLERYENGILCAPPAFGKIVLAAYLISKRKVSTLILLDKTDLCDQWIREFERFLDVDEKPSTYKTQTGREKTRDSVFGTLISGIDKTTNVKYMHWLLRGQLIFRDWLRFNRRKSMEQLIFRGW